MAKPKPTSIVGQFIAHRVEMLESYAWGQLSLAARRILDRLEIEHANHGGKENGRLPCTYGDFEAFGIRRKSIRAALTEVVSLGFVEITHKGRGGNGDFRDPSLYRLTYLATVERGGRRAMKPSDEWRRQENRDPRGENAPGTRGENATG